MVHANPIPKGRNQLSQVLQGTGDLISVADVTGALHITPRDATRLLARWSKQGWIRRLQRGLYAPVPIASLGQSQVLDDPWLIVPAVFGPAYIGGWTAAEHWGLTEQLFRSICVLTTRPVRGKERTIQGVEFTLKQIPKRSLFATNAIWRGKVKIDVSNPAKTIIDMLDDPTIGGGIRHVGDCLNTFLAEGKGTVGDLLSIAERMHNGAIFKRLGFLAERRGGPEELIVTCRERLTTGNAQLDPSIASPRLIKRWRLWVPQSWLQAPAA